jgi:hypothetical protein
MILYNDFEGSFEFLSCSGVRWTGAATYLYCVYGQIGQILDNIVVYEADKVPKSILHPIVWIRPGVQNNFRLKIKHILYLHGLGIASVFISQDFGCPVTFVDQFKQRICDNYMQKSC